MRRKVHTDIAKKQALAEQSLPGIEDSQMSLQFLVMEMGSTRYKIFGMVTNISETDMNGEEIIHWLHARCGKSEEVHSDMKADFAGRTLPVGKNPQNYLRMGQKK